MIEIGIHTFSKYHSLTYSDANALITSLMSHGKGFFLWQNTRATQGAYFCYQFSEAGVLIYVYLRREGSGFSFRIIPSTLLSSHFAATKLYQPSPETYWEINNTLDDILVDLDLFPEIKANDMTICRADPCINLYLDHESKCLEYIRIFKKSASIPHYAVDRFDEETKYIQDPDEANRHSFRLKAKRSAFTIYDKKYQLQQMNRCPSDLTENEMLRLEAGLKRDAFLRRITTTRESSEYEILKDVSEHTLEIISNFLLKLKIGLGDHVRYCDAVKTIENSRFQSKLKKRMLYLIRKASDSNSSDAALLKMKRKFSLSETQCDMILQKFDELGISPITLRNDCEFQQLPSLLSLISTNQKMQMERDADGFIQLCWTELDKQRYANLRKSNHSHK